MANALPPAPTGSPPGSYAWTDWYNKLRSYVAVYGVTWSAIDKTGSNITDLATRLHNTLQSIQGGAAGDYNHLTTAQVALLTGAAPLASPTFTGDPKAPTPMAGDNDTSIATTAYVQTELTAKAALASPTFTGTPAAPTASAGTNTTQIATTAYVKSQGYAPTASPVFTTSVGFNGSTAITKPTITGSRGGNVALANLLTQLANYGLITDSTTV